jgi:hypothetical protein
VRIRYRSDRRLPFGLQVTTDRETATREIAVIETEAQRG